MAAVESQIVERIKTSMLPSLARDTAIDIELLCAVVDGSPDVELTDEDLCRVVYDLGLVGEPGDPHNTVAWLDGRSVGTAISEEIVAGCARAAHMHPVHLRHILDGRRYPSSLDIALLSETLGVEVHWLLTGEPDPMRVRVICALPRSEENA